MEQDYARAKIRGDLAHYRAMIAGEQPYIVSLDSFLKDSNSLQQVDLGMMELPVESIVGTKTDSRQNAFAPNFMPLLDPKSEFGRKWSALYDSCVQDGVRESIKVYEYLRKFYVQEGNKRVSVMRYLGIQQALAHVIRILPKNDGSKKIRLYYEFLSFYDVTHLYAFNFSFDGGYRRLAHALGQDLVHKWPENAVSNAKTEIYYFTRLLKAEGSAKLSITPSDAFLIYLRFYPAESLLNESEKMLRERIRRLWNEFLTAGEEDDLYLITDDSKIQEGSGGYVSIIPWCNKYTARHPLKTAFLYVGKTENSGWNYSHEFGRHYLESAFPDTVQTSAYDDLHTDEDIRHAIDEAVKAGNEVVITTSPAQAAETLKAAIHYPDIKFLNCAINLNYNAVRTYYGRMYEAKFLMGMIAASRAKNHKIGYHADYPLYGSIANINAFAIGAGMIDPSVKIYLKWSSVKDSAQAFLNIPKDIVIFSGRDSIIPSDPGREYGVYEKMPDGSVVNYGAPIWNWGVFYKDIIRTVLNGQWEMRNVNHKNRSLAYWWGMNNHAIDVIISDKLPYYTRKLVDAARRDIINGTVTPFDGELHSQKGIIKRADDTRLNNMDIITMSWLNDNVVGKIPPREDLNEKALNTVRVPGISTYS